MHVRMLSVIVREGILALLTGGFFFDSSQTHFVNVVHFYIWITFFVSPLAIYLVTDVSRLIGVAYSLTIGSIVLCIKYFTWRLHYLLDINTPITEENPRESRNHCVELEDTDNGAELADSAKSIEEKCRQIGLAGLRIADNTEALSNYQSACQQPPVPGEPFTQDEFTVKFIAKPTSSVTDCATSPNRTDELVPPLDCNLELSKPVSVGVPCSVEQFNSTYDTSINNGQSLNPDECGSQDVSNNKSTAENTVEVDDECTPQATTSVSDNRLIKLRRKFSVTTRIYRVPRRRNSRLIGMRFGHLIQRSIDASSVEKLTVDCCNWDSCDYESTANGIRQPNYMSFHPTLANTSLEQCKHILRQLKYDVNRLNLESNNRFVKHSNQSVNGINESPCLEHQQQNQRISPLDDDMAVCNVLFNDLSLNDTILYWRQYFFHSNARRPLRSNSLTHQPASIVSTKPTVNKLDSQTTRSLEKWRTHSLRNDIILMPNSSRLYFRPRLRRPGSALRLRRQLSAGSASSMTATSSAVSKSLVKHCTSEVNSTSSVYKSIVENIVSSGQAILEDLERPTEFVNTKNSSSGSGSSVASNIKVDTKESEVQSTSHSGCHDHVERGDSKDPSLSVRLVRKPGFRRKPTGSKSEHHYALYDKDKTTEFDTLSQPNKQVINVNNESTAPVMSTHPTSAEQVVDNLLACLMGASSLSETGLTQQQCLLQLRGDASHEDAENAELDILFALNEAAGGLTNSNFNNYTEISENNPPVPTDPLPSCSNHSYNDSITLMDKQCTSSVNNGHCDIQMEQTAAIGDIQRKRSSSSSFTSSIGSVYYRHHQHHCHTSPTTRSRSDKQKKANNTTESGGNLYILNLIPCIPLKCRLQLDRLQLTSLFDRSFTKAESALCVFLAVLVSFVGYNVLGTGNFRDFKPVICCFTIAGCHYSLVKSVQPDPASPKHGFNRWIVFSRSVFFCIIAILHLISDFLSQQTSLTSSVSPKCPIKSSPTYLSSQSVSSSSGFVHEHIGELRYAVDSVITQSGDSQMLPSSGSVNNYVNLDSSSLLLYRTPISHYIINSDRSNSAIPVNFYGFHITINSVLCCIDYTCVYMILLFPLFFCLGLIPQINTFLIYALEQIDIHVFGATGTTGLFSVCVSIMRSLLVIVITFAPCYYALLNLEAQAHLLSLFWGLHIALCYVLSRLPANIRLYILLLPCYQKCIGYCNQLRSWFNMPWLIKQNLIVKSCDWSKKRKSQTTQRCTTDWWRRRLPLFLSNFGLKSNNALVNDLTREQLVPLSHNVTGFTLDSERNKNAQLDSNTVNCQIIRSVQSNSLPVLVNNSKKLIHFHSLSTIVSNQHRTPNEQQYQQLATTIDNSKHSLVNDCIQRNKKGEHFPSEIRLSKPTFHSITDCDADRKLVDPNYTVMENLIRDVKEDEDSSDEGVQQQANIDPLPALIKFALVARFKNDLLIGWSWFVLIGLLHFSELLSNPTLEIYFYQVFIWSGAFIGCLIHYVWPNLRKPYPWLLFVRPFIPPHAKGELINIERFYYWLSWIERNIAMPLITIVTTTSVLSTILAKFGPLLTTLIVIITSMKMLRNGFCNIKQIYLNIFFTNLLFSFDFRTIDETFPVNYFFISIVMSKIIELSNKLNFMYVYLAPLNTIWGSVAHVFVQLGSIPHAVFMFANCLLSTVLSAPLEPFVASAVFITSYVRPISFWETNHRTQRLETTNMPMAAQLRGISKQQLSDNLDGIFYEHLTRKLQRNLAGDINLGRFGGLAISHGDVFILSTDDLNLLIHIIEVGNGYITFQLRGLEFVGTLCHASESETLRSDPYMNHLCCRVHYVPPLGLLGFNTFVKLRCMTWQFAYIPYVIEGYDITDHCARVTFQLTDLRKILISRFVHCIIYYVTKLPQLVSVLHRLTPTLEANLFFHSDYADLDPVFFKVIDEDYDEDVNGVTRQLFVDIYLPWVVFCVRKHKKYSVTCTPDSPVVSLCFALSLLGRRCIVSNNRFFDQFLHGINQIFSGEISLNSRDDWVLAELSLLQTVITPSLRIALKLYQDTFTWNVECTFNELYDKIVFTERNVVICRETDPKWRFAVLADADCLFTFRCLADHSLNDKYRIVQLTKRNLEFRVIKLNSECVRGLWAGQQREQIFLRNNNEERGSIQSATSVLRNLVNSSCDPPIGYPIYVSPLITSFVGDNEIYRQVAGPELSLITIFQWFYKLWRNFHSFCCGFCRKSGFIDHPTVPQCDIELSSVREPPVNVQDGSLVMDTQNEFSQTLIHSLHLSQHHYECPSTSTEVSVTAKPNLPRQGPLLNGIDTAELVTQPSTTTVCIAKIMDPSQILDCYLNKLIWPSNEWHRLCLTYSTCKSSVYCGLEAQIVHRWTANNVNVAARSFCHKTIALLSFVGGPPLLEGHYVAIWETKGLQRSFEVN